MSMIFEWDETKAVANIEKHGISFDEAQTIFSDPDSLTIYDDAHSENEERFIDIGRSTAGRILVVVYTERDDRIRIITSRFATARERAQYAQHDT